MWSSSSRASKARLVRKFSKEWPLLIVRSNYSSEQSKLPEIPKPTRTGLQASFPRGTGGRLSFSGNVCTVFGSSGFLGHHVVNALAKDGTQIIVPYRGDPYDVKHMKIIGDLGQILFFPFNLRDEDSIRKVVRHSNVVVNMIGRDLHTFNYSMYDVNGDGARRIARICKEMGVRRLIHVSALNAEENPPEYFLPGGSEFLRSKALGEKYVRDEFPDAVIVRPSPIYGYNDRFFFPFCHQMRRSLGNRVALFREGNSVYKSPVYFLDVANGIAQLVKDPTQDGKTFEFFGPHWYLMADIIDWLYQYNHRDVNTYGRQNIDFWMSMKCNFFSYMEWLSRGPWPFDWDFVERTECMSDLLTGCPSLEEVGVTPSVIEDKLAGTLMFKYFDRRRAYKPELGEYPDVPWPKRYPPMYKPKDVRLSEKYETVNTKIVYQPSL